ncbi:MAG: hypothetical protein ACK4FK_05750 [Ferrovibrio sp.]|uniref:hypothetical protein n=1 Tax=Ferrovibrio sp. TaxID=1917215 RepID=UPI00391ACC99
MYLDAKGWLKTTRADDAAIFIMLAQVAVTNPVMSQAERRSINNIKYRLVRCGYNLYDSELDDLRRVVARAGYTPQILVTRDESDHDSKDLNYARQFNTAKAERRMTHLLEVLNEPIPGVNTVVTMDQFMDDYVKSMTGPDKSDAKPKAKASSSPSSGGSIDKEVFGALLIRLNGLTALVEELHEKIDRLESSMDQRGQFLSLAATAK